MAPPRDRIAVAMGLPSFDGRRYARYPAGNKWVHGAGGVFVAVDGVLTDAAGNPLSADAAAIIAAGGTLSDVQAAQLAGGGSIASFAAGALSGGYIFYDDFSSGDLSKTTNGFVWESPTHASVINGFGPNGKSNCLRFDYTQTGGQWSEQRFALGAIYPEVWLRYWIFFPLGNESPSRGAKWQRDDGGVVPYNNKFFRLYAGVAGDELFPRVGAETYPRDSAALDCQLYPEAAITGRSGIGPFWNDDPVPVADPFVIDSARGRWVKIKAQNLKSTDANTSNGVQRIWVDDVLVASKTNIQHQQGVGGFEGGYLMGSFNGYINSMCYVGDITFSASDPDA